VRETFSSLGIDPATIWRSGELTDWLGGWLEADAVVWVNDRLCEPDSEHVDFALVCLMHIACDVDPLSVLSSLEPSEVDWSHTFDPRAFLDTGRHQPAVRGAPAELTSSLEEELDRLLREAFWPPELDSLWGEVAAIERRRGVSFRFGGVETWTAADDPNAHDEVVFLEAGASRKDSYEITKELDAAMARFLTSPESSKAKARWPRLALGIVWPDEE